MKLNRSQLFAFLPQRCVIMLEDVDAVGITEDREKQPKEGQKEPGNEATMVKKPKKSEVILSGLLNAIGE